MQQNQPLAPTQILSLVGMCSLQRTAMSTWLKTPNILPPGPEEAMKLALGNLPESDGEDSFIDSDPYAYGHEAHHIYIYIYSTYSSVCDICKMLSKVGYLKFPANPCRWVWGANLIMLRCCKPLWMLLLRMRRRGWRGLSVKHLVILVSTRMFSKTMTFRKTAYWVKLPNPSLKPTLHCGSGNPCEITAWCFWAWWEDFSWSSSALICGAWESSGWKSFRNQNTLICDTIGQRQCDFLVCIQHFPQMTIVLSVGFKDSKPLDGAPPSATPPASWLYYLQSEKLNQCGIKQVLYKLRFVG